MAGVTQNFDEEGKKIGIRNNKQSGWRYYHKKPQLHCPRMFKKNDATDNQDNFIESETLEIGPLKNSSKTGQLKDDRKYISSNDFDKLQNNSQFFVN